MRTAWVGAVCLAIAASASAQPRGGIVQATLTNGTTGAPGSAEKVTLLRLGGDMTPVKELGAVTGSFEITGIEVEGERPMLLQVTYGGVNYNQPVNFGRGYEAVTEVTVYDAFDAWEDQALVVTTSRFLYRREGDSLLVDKVFVVENRSSPPRTYYNPEGTFRFNLPTDDLIEMGAITASSALGVPVPQSASPLADGSGFVTKTAFKPGETQFAISYEVRYEGATFTANGQAFFPLADLLVFVAPPDIEIDAPGWELLGIEPEGRFAAMRLFNVSAGDPIRFTLSGGSVTAPPLTSSAGGGGSASQQTGARGTLTRIPDTTRASKWVIVVLMAAALGFGLLRTLWPPTPHRS